MQRVWNHQWVRRGAVVVWMGVIFYLSAQSTLPDLTGGRFPELASIAGHFTVYFVLALLWRRVLAGAGVRRPVLWAFALTLLYGVSDEFHQGFVPRRHPDIFDLPTDAAGAAFAISHCPLGTRPPRLAGVRLSKKRLA